MIVTIAVLIAAAIATSRYRARRARPEVESPRVGTIDYYGLHTVNAGQLREKLNLKEGDIAPLDTQGTARRLEQIPGVARAYVTVVRNSEGQRASLFIGIEENNAKRFDYRSVPAGTVALPKQIAEAYTQMILAMPNALASGADEDDSQGNALIQDATMLPLEQKMIAFAASDTEVLRDVLKNSADASQRIAAAWIIGYAPDKRAIIGDLMDAVRDSDQGVRNNATRAIAVISEFASDRPELGIHIDPSPFIDMLNSLIWTDRNKATAVLLALTEKPEPAILESLREHAVPALTEMSGWKDVHSQDALLLLGRIPGRSATASTKSSASESLPGH